MTPNRPAIKSKQFTRLLRPAFLFLALLSLILVSCDGQKSSDNNKIVIGIPSDVQTINPMFAFNVIEGHLVDLLFLKPAIEIWNDSLGIIEFEPMLAKRWEWNEDSTSITLYLRDNIYWSDKKPITVNDIIFSFEIYSDPKVDSRFLGQFYNFNTIDGLQIDSEKTFEVISPKILTINFLKGALSTLIDINLEIIPKHIWSKYPREEIVTAQENFEPVTSGPFKLSQWNRMSTIYLDIDSSSFLYNPDNIQKIIFKVIPDYNSRIYQLKTGEVDLVEDIKREDIAELNLINELEITSLRGREYDYIGWNHIDPAAFQQNQIIPNKYFSSPQIRKALTYAINRQEIVNSYLSGYAEVCKGPVSPMFKIYFDDLLEMDEYNPGKAREILKQNGWTDKNNNGVIEKSDTEFKIELYTNSGNPRREYVATIIKNNLHAIGIDVNIQILESGVFIDGLMKRNYDAWISGWTIPIPIDLNPFWNSDIDIGIFNFSTYQSKVKDEILDSLAFKLTERKKTAFYKKLQNIFYNDEPVTFLYWFDNIIVYNKRISKIRFSQLGLVKNAWEWQVN
jgi:peptide/nickel transport system substrate-binding protein